MVVVVRDWHQQTFPFPVCSHETVTEHWNTCGPEWYNNNFVSPGNDVFPESGNTRLRLEQETGNGEDKHLLFHCMLRVFTLFFFTKYCETKQRPCHQTFSLFGMRLGFSRSVIVKIHYSYTPLVKNTIENISKNIQ